MTNVTRMPIAHRQNARRRATPIADAPRAVVVSIAERLDRVQTPEEQIERLNDAITEIAHSLLAAVRTIKSLTGSVSVNLRPS